MSEFPPIPVFRPAISEEEIQAVTEALRSGWIGAGPRTTAFEKEFAAFAGTGHAVATTNCTSALTATLAALGVGPGDDVIVPSFTWPSIFQVLRTLGANPVFADIDPRYLTLDVADVEARITSRTKGIVVVHHGGHLADIAALRELADKSGIWLVDDAAHACGSRGADGRPVGSYCRATCFSFNAVKNLSAGDGGMMTTDDADLARKVRQYVSLGLDRDTFARYGPGHENDTRRWFYDLGGAGQRFHMNDITAALATVQLRRLPGLNDRREEVAARYREAFQRLSNVRWIEPRPGTRPSWHMFTLLMPERDRYIHFMSQRSIAIGVHYRPLHEFAIASRWSSRLPVTEEIAACTATLPLYPTLTEIDQQRVIEATLQFFQAMGDSQVRVAAV